MASIFFLTTSLPLGLRIANLLASSPEVGGLAPACDAALFDHRAQLFAIRGAVERVLERDVAAAIEREERLVHRLHRTLRLANLHLRIDLVELVLEEKMKKSNDLFCDVGLS